MQGGNVLKHVCKMHQMYLIAWSAPDFVAEPAQAVPQLLTNTMSRNLTCQKGLLHIL